MKYVYLMRCGNDHYKVGVAVNLKHRLGGLQTSNPEPIEIVSTKLCDNAEVLEGQLHTYLLEHKTNGGTEWFKLNPEQVIEVSVMMNKWPEVANLAETVTIKGLITKQTNEVEAIKRSLKFILDFIQKEIDLKDGPEIGTVPTSKKVRETNDEEYINKALEVFKKHGRASASLLQVELAVGYAKAARIVNMLEQKGLVSSYDGPHSRKVIDAENLE